MNNRTIKNIYPSFPDNIGNLRTVRPVPSPKIQMLDPFLFLNHHGPQVYPANNRGLPFGLHPHRGFQTVTFILEGDIAHRDSAGHESVIGPGGVQWMSAGRGLIHEEVSSTEFKKSGGHLEILQLWVNLPSQHKMTDPYYVGLQKNEIPTVSKNQVLVQVIAGKFERTLGPFTPSTELKVMTLNFCPDSSIDLPISANETIFFYVVRGEVQINDQMIQKENLVEFNSDGDQISVTAREEALILLCHAQPYNEPVVFGGPFVMNTEAEIRQAYLDYQNGKF